MTLKFHNTLTGNIDEFVSQVPGKVSLYTCGPTVYDYPHIGNWTAYIYWDILVRILIANEYEVNRVMNITDVGHLVSDADEGEDKLEKGARREGKTAWEIAEFYTTVFMNGMNELGLIIPEHIAKATDFIDQQLDFIRTLKEKGYTYQIDDGIYFDTSKFSKYADFAHLNLDDQKAGARVEYNSQKRNISDFALWKFSDPNTKRDMEWETPEDLLEDRNWNIEDGKLPNSDSRAAEATVLSNPLEPKSDMAPGPISDMERSRITKNSGEASEQIKYGFPGWHLECSAIAKSILGNTLDIHTGGIDHIPVHHTNEIAQSEAANGVRLSNYWLHNNHIKVDSTKISKSLGNGYTLEDLAKKGFTPIDYRMLVLQGHYRNEGNFTFESLLAAKNRLDSWRSIAALRHQIHETLKSQSEMNDDNHIIPSYATSSAILEAISNDLGTPEALKIIDNAFSDIGNAKLSRINQDALIQLIETIDELLGLNLINSTPDISDEAKQIIIERKRAREQQDWKKSDELRIKLNKIGIAIRDTNSDCIWQYIN